MDKQLIMDTRFVSIQLSNGKTIQVESRFFDDSTENQEIGDIIEGEVSGVFDELKSAKDTIKGIIDDMTDILEKVKPDKAIIEFGIEFGVASGEIMAFVVKGEGKSNFKFILEWNYLEHTK